jgi:hypothetical protein
MKFWIPVILLFICIPLSGQKILLDKDVSKAYQNIRGPNTKSFKQVYFGTGLIVNYSKYTEINNLRSGYLAIGFRQKYKLLSFYSIGYEMGYHAMNFNISQAEGKTIPNEELHDKEKLKFHSGNLLLFNRLNIGKRGNFIGRFIDFGCYINYIFSSTHYTKDKIQDETSTSDPDVYAEVRIVKNSRLDYIQNFGYGLFARAGINWAALNINYRISDLFKEKYQWTELPRLSVGFELTIPNQ